MYKRLVLILGYTGLRRGEAAALRVGRVDMLRGRILVAEAMSEVGGEAEFDTPKGHQQRIVPVVRSLHKDLARACEGKGRNDLVFPAKRGGVPRVDLPFAAGRDTGSGRSGVRVGRLERHEKPVHEL